ncbi:MAG: serine acetyltransferase [Clostridia bacterium]|nr:serine acetyltransferase [Clostridia bacterium]
MEKSIKDIYNLILKDVKTSNKSHKLLPTDKEVACLTEDLRKLVLYDYFANLNEKDFFDYSSDVFEELKRQLKCVLEFDADKNNHPMPTDKQIDDLANEYFERLKIAREFIVGDTEAAYIGDPAATSKELVVAVYPGYFAIVVYRLAHELATLGIPTLPRMMSEYAHSKTGIDIHPKATIGKNFFIDHGTGVVVGETTQIGDNVKIYQGVTLGALSTRKVELLRGKKRHPTIENNVTIYANATILGGETVIGENAVIGGGAFIMRSVDKNAKISVCGTI